MKQLGSEREARTGSTATRFLEVLCGLFLLVAGYVGARSSPDRMTYVMQLSGALMGTLVAWAILQRRNKPLTLGWVVLGSALGALVLAAAMGAAGGQWENLWYWSTYAAGAGAVIGLILALINRGLRGPLPRKD